MVNAKIILYKVWVRVRVKVRVRVRCMPINYLPYFPEIFLSMQEYKLLGFWFGSSGIYRRNR